MRSDLGRWRAVADQCGLFSVFRFGQRIVDWLCGHPCGGDRLRDQAGEERHESVVIGTSSANLDSYGIVSGKSIVESGYADTRTLSGSIRSHDKRHLNLNCIRLS